MDTENVVCGLIVIAAIIGIIFAPMSIEAIAGLSIAAILLIKLL